MAEQKRWNGSPITRCDLCRCTIKHVNGKQFVDGAVKGKGVWAVMCSSCYSRYGSGLGSGKGQMYQFNQVENAWLKIGG